MHLRTIFTTLLLAVGLAAAVTLPEAAAMEKRHIQQEEGLIHGLSWLQYVKIRGVADIYFPGDSVVRMS
ncbi:hypothetical protein DFH06DRAFT_1336543 [Mycena polygramma]|nr:hypothetical protein DFH06DRAFT_1351856 [Mycena polygramma]KAJ7635522.1 hypothetical protein DFH06DRAFT_1336543 [Mycena polygramma]